MKKALSPLSIDAKKLSRFIVSSSFVYGIDRIPAPRLQFETRTNANRNPHTYTTVVVFPSGRIPNDIPVYSFTYPAGLRQLGSRAESPGGSAPDGRSSSACNRRAACYLANDIDSCDGTERDPASDHDWASTADHDKGGGAWCNHYAASANARHESANHSDDCESGAKRQCSDGGASQ